jgi:RNA polymerase sigma-70 factor, ECF subfamily
MSAALSPSYGLTLWWTVPPPSRGSLPVHARARHGSRQEFWAGYVLAKGPAENDAARELAEIRAVAAGDAAAFARLIDRESPRLLRFAKGLLGTLEEAEDVVQETLLRLFENAEKWEPQARIGTWLHRVCYNRSIDILRRRRSFVEESALDEMPDSADLPDSTLLRRETALSVREAMEQLPHRQRTAVLLFHFQELSQGEAAGVMGISEVAFESLLARARRQMRVLLRGGGDA